MIVLLWAFTLFDLAAAAAAGAQALRLASKSERGQWRSQRLYLFACFICWSFLIAALACCALAWLHFLSGQMDAVPIVIAPIAWLLAMGAAFAIFDFAEDGVLGNARRKDGEA